MSYTVSSFFAKGCNSFMKSKIGTVIRRKRKELGYTQERLAERVGVTPSYIGQIERGHTYPSFEVLANITLNLAIDANQYFHDNNEPHRERREFYQIYEQLPPDMRKLAKDMLRLIYKSKK